MIASTHPGRPYRYVAYATAQLPRGRVAAEATMLLPESRCTDELGDGIVVYGWPASVRRAWCTADFLRSRMLYTIRSTYPLNVNSLAEPW